MLDPLLLALIAGFFGLLLGSFLNVCIYRLPRDLSVVHPRSFCPSCEKTVAWYDNVPILSFFLLGRRCRYCQATISWLYPSVELVTGILFFLAVLWHGWTWHGAKMCVFAAIMVDLIVTDLETRILPDEFTYGGALAGWILSWFAPLEPGLTRLFLPRTLSPQVQSLVESIFASVFGAGLLWFIGWAYLKIRKREGLGLGDVKMLLTIGAFLGFSGTMISLFFGSLLGSIVGIAYIAITRQEMTYELPFGSFLGAGALFIGLGGERLFRLLWGRS